MSNYHEISYQKHKEHFNNFDQDHLNKHAAWFDDQSVDYWRHSRMIEPLKPLLNLNKNSKWLTVGDGRFGLDSIRLKRIENSLKILPTDISPYLLEIAKKDGKIENFSV